MRNEVNKVEHAGMSYEIPQRLWDKAIARIETIRVNAKK